MLTNQICDLSGYMIKNIREAIDLLKSTEEVEIWRKHVNQIILLINKCIANKRKCENFIKLEM